jgi:hypothetical protein
MSRCDDLAASIRRKNGGTLVKWIDLPSEFMGRQDANVSTSSRVEGR